MKKKHVSSLAYEGYWHDGCLFSETIFTLSDGDMQIGEVKNIKKEGTWQMFKTNGDILK